MAERIKRKKAAKKTEAANECDFGPEEPKKEEVLKIKKKDEGGREIWRARRRRGLGEGRRPKRAL